MKRLFSKINTRVFVGVFGVSALITAVVGISAYSLLDGVYKRNLRRTLSDVSTMVVNAIGGGSKTELAEAARVCSAFSGKNHMRATLVGADGSVFFDSDCDGAGMQNHLKRREISRALEGEISNEIRYSQTLKTRMLYLSNPAGKQDADGLASLRGRQNFWRRATKTCRWRAAVSRKSGFSPTRCARCPKSSAGG